MKNRMKTFLNHHLEEIFLLPGLFFLVISLGVEVVRRYVLKMPGAYTSEAATFVFVWIVYIGIGYGAKQKKHITLDLLPEDLPPRVDRGLNILSIVIQIGFYAFLIYQSAALIAFNREVGMVSRAMNASLWIVLLCFPIGFLLGIFRLGQRLCTVLRSGRPSQESVFYEH